MTIGTSLILIALGAILRFAVADGVDAIDLSTIGLILMAVGAVGFLIGLFMLSDARRRDVDVVRERDTRRVE